MNKIHIYFLLLLIIPVHAYSIDEQVNYIVIDGNQRITSSEIIDYSRIEIGKTYTKNDISVFIKNLFSTNLFKDIKIKIENNTAYIYVTERQIISKILIDGNNLVETEQIMSSLKGIGISQSKPYNKSLIDKVQQELIRLYYDNGRYSSVISIIEKELDNNLVELSLNIDEGSASTIKEIKIIGNNNFSDRLLKSLIKSGPKYWFEVWSDKDIYNSTLLDQDIEAIRDYYFNRGYAKFNVVSKQVNLSPNKENIYITLSIDEGELFKFGTIKAYGLEKFSSEIYANVFDFNLKPGSIFSRSRIEATEESIKFLLGEEGYAFPKISLFFS